MAEYRHIMWIGPGPRETKTDVLFPDSGRVWERMGAIHKVSPIEAVKHVKHPDQFMDVTDLSQDERNAIVAAYRKQYDRARAAQMERNLGVKTLEGATEEELAARLDALQSRAPAETVERGDEAEKPNEAELTEAAREEMREKLVEAISLLDSTDPDQFDENGLPQTRFLAQLASLTDVSEAQRDEAWKLYNERQLD